MITSFRHKGLKLFYEKGDRSGLRTDLVGKIKIILTMLEAAETPEELNIPTFRFHSLTGDRKGIFSVTVRASWRITFAWNEEGAHHVNLEDYH